MIMMIIIQSRGLVHGRIPHPILEDVTTVVVSRVNASLGHERRLRNSARSRERRLRNQVCCGLIHGRILHPILGNVTTAVISLATLCRKKRLCVKASSQLRRHDGHAGAGSRVMGGGRQGTFLRPIL